MTATVKRLIFLLLMLLHGGCATTYVPVSWGIGDRVQRLSRSDPTLSTLFARYDPQRITIRVNGPSFDEVVMPEEVKFHLGAYRRDTRLIYRNLYNDYSDSDLRDLMVHELAHHVWFTAMPPEKQIMWMEYLKTNPSPMQLGVRRTYRPDMWAAEDFAFTLEYARPDDIAALAELKLLTEPERDLLLAEMAARKSKGPRLGSSQCTPTVEAATKAPDPAEREPPAAKRP